MRRAGLFYARRHKQKPERFTAAPAPIFRSPARAGGAARFLRYNRNISVSTHAPAGARRIYACLTYLRKRLLIVIPRYDAESSVVKFRNVSESEAAGPRVHRRKRRR